MHNDHSAASEPVHLAGNQPELDAAIAGMAAAVRSHYANVIIPMWRGRGYNLTMQLPYEALDTTGVIEPKRYRAMACARQLYVHSVEGDKRHADALFESLVEYFFDGVHGGFFYSVDPIGYPLETDKDLYTHAFVIFACAAYLEAFSVKKAKRVLAQAFDTVGQRFSIDARTGLSNASMSRDFSLVKTPSRQNPLMHLSEAYLMAARVTGDRRFDEALATLLNAMSTKFVDSASGCILELPEGDAENWIEPGHQFEWFFLAQNSGHPAFQHSGLGASLMRAFTFAKHHGVDHVTGGVAASLGMDGLVLDGTQRIWAQTEYLRALACHPDPSQRTALARQLEQFNTRHLHARGWHEAVTSDGSVSRGDMPSTTAYHLISGYLALP